MAEPVLMPKQGQSVESCIITEWYKSKGDQVSKGDLLFAYETDKASFEEEAQADGTLIEVFFEAGDEVPVLTNVAVIGNEGDDTSAFLPEGATASESSAQEEAPNGGTPDGTAANTEPQAATPTSPQQPPAAAETGQGAASETSTNAVTAGTAADAGAGAAASTGATGAGPNAGAAGTGAAATTRSGKIIISPRAKKLAESRNLSPMISPDQVHTDESSFAISNRRLNLVRHNL